MCGITNRFVSDYREFKKSGGKIDNNELKKLSNLMVSTGNNAESINALKNEILNDGTLDAEEKKLLLTIGFSADESTLKEIQTHLSPASDDTVSSLLSKGFAERGKAINAYKKENPNLAGARDKGADISNSAIGFVKSMLPDAVRKGANNIIGRDNTRESLKVNTTANAGVFSDVKTTEKFFNDSNFRKLSASESTVCIDKAVGAIVGKAKGSIGSMTLNEGSLKKITGKDWDAMEVAHYKNNPSKMKSLLEGQEGKAIVKVGFHTFVYQGLDNKGNLKVTDPSENNVARLISKDNPSATVFVQKVNGKGGDGAESNVASTQKAAKGFNAFKAANTPENINSADRADKSGESFNVRKLLVLLGDKDQKGAANKIFDELKKPNPNINVLKAVLNSSGIKLENQEIQAFATMMKKPVKAESGRSTTMLEQFAKIAEKPNSERANYLNGVEYSDISLKDYFTRVEPQNIANTLQGMIKGCDGC